MSIRRTQIKILDHGGVCFIYRIAESVRVGEQIKQCTLLNPGKDFAIEPAHWPLLTARIEQFLEVYEPHQAELYDLAADSDLLLESAAQRPDHR
jgi:hypothetical protein